MRRVIDLTDRKFGRVTAIKLMPETSTSRGARWFCRCDCGKEFTTDGSSLRCARTKSCGCATIEKSRLRVKPYSGMKSLISQYRSRAKSSKQLFTLSDAAFMLLTSSDCYYCGLPPSKVRTSSSGRSPYRFNGLDRVDSDQGYEFWNCVPSCIECNYAKNAMPRDDFDQWRHRVAVHYAENIGL